MVPNGLPKSARLYGKTAIAALMKGGRWGFAGCLKYCWMPREAAQNAGGAAPEAAGQTASRLMVSVPKRLFKRAVKRNLLKRRIREAYRVRKPEGIDILIQYNSPEIQDFASISAAVASILEKIAAINCPVSCGENRQ